MNSVKLLICLISMLLISSVSYAQSGKITGTVTDNSSGDPLPGVNVVLDGTTTGAVTDADGVYTILNVRPGTYAVRATFIGYTASVVQNVIVNIDLTTIVDIAMQEQTVGLDEVIVTSERPIIQRDIAASERNITSQEIQSAPFQNVANILTANVGVNDVSNFEDRPEIRGSDFDESLFIVDGVNQGDVLTNRPHYRVNLDAVEEVKVQTGGFSAEYGNVRSSVISVVTKEGGDRYSGSVNVQYSAPAQKSFGPDPFGFESPLVQPFVDPALGAFEGGTDINNQFNFDGWNVIASELGEGDAHAGAPMELYARYLWRHRSQDAVDELKRLQDMGIVQFADGVNPDDMVFHQTGVDPDYNASFTLGGPVPLLEQVRFFVAYDRTQTEYLHRFPQRSFQEDNLRGKLTMNVGVGMKLNLHGFYSKQRGGDGGQGPGISGFISSNPFVQTDAENKYWYPNCAVPGIQTRQIYGAQFTHAVTPNTFYDVDLVYDLVDYEMDLVFRNTAPIPGAGGIPSSSGTSGSGVDAGRIGTTAEADARAAAGQEGWGDWRDWAMIQIGDHWYDEAPKGYGPVNWRDITGEYRMESCNLRANETNTRGFELKGNVTSQIDRHNQVRAGFQIRRDMVEQYYEAIDPSVNAGNVWQSEAEPWRGAVFVQDKLEFQGFVATVGLRFDWMSTGNYPAILEGCDLEDPSSCAGDDGPYSQFLNAGNTTVEAEDGSLLGAREAVLFDNLGEQSITHTRLSPRVGVSHPISTVAKIFFNYGHFYQWPTALQLYETRMDTRRGFRLVDFGNPSLEPERTIQYELGYEQNLFDMMNLRLTGYFKDINNEINQVDIFPLAYGGGNYDVGLNNGFRDIRGLEAFLELRRGVVPFFSGWVSANYLVESGARYGFQDFFEDPSRQPVFQNTEVSNPDVRPIIKSMVNFSTPSDWDVGRVGNQSLLGGLDISLLYTWQRGASFTWNPASFPLVEDNLRWRPYQRFDLRLTKDLFSSGGFDAQFYIDVTNLFNHRNMTQFAGGTGTEDSVTRDRNYAWDGHRWWNTEVRDYLESLGYTADNQNPDGSFNNVRGDVGDWDEDFIDRTAFSPYEFFGIRDIFFGVKFYF